jgi:hypothetical protein
MKKLILTAGICISSLLCVQAQQTTTSTTDQKVEKMMNSITTICHLTPDQVTKVKPIMVEFVNAVTANKEKFGADKDKLKAANEASRNARDTKLAAILSADQQKELAEKEKEMAAKQKGGSN